VRDAIAKHNVPVLPELKDFYARHRKSSETGNLSQYISYSLLASGPPTFELPSSVPPDVEPLQGLSPLLARFYKQANIEELWNRSKPAYMAAIRGYQDAVIETIFETNGYVRNPSGYLGRRFQIYLDLMGAPDQVHVRSYANDYFVVITPSSVPLVDEVRDAYLAYLLDPLTLKFGDTLKEKRPLLELAQDAPALDLAYKDDFSLLVTKSLIKAIDSRVMHGSAEQRQAFVDQAMREGFILTAAFAEQLPVYERQDQSLRDYYAGLVSNIDLHKERKRIKTIQFTSAPEKRVIAPAAKLEVSPAEQSLAAAEGLYERADYENAAKEFKNVLARTEDKAVKGRAFFGLALIRLQEKHWDEAVELFQRTIASSNYAPTLAWAHYYLGQMDLKQGDQNKAQEEFKLALATEGASAKLREAAEAAIQKSSSREVQPQ
jgi:predicted negative regulator of RcsB-dependent stress response